MFVKDWANLIRSFPSLFNEGEADMVIRSHSIKTGIFEILGLIRLRSLGVLNKVILTENYKDFAVASGHVIMARLLCNLPARLCYFAVLLGKSGKSIYRSILDIAKT